jgi:CheY-like chemotaxis protein/two-component sensor histidine kinase
MRDDLLEIRRAAYRAAELTGQLLAFSRKQVMRVEALDLGEVVKSLEKMLRRVIHESILFDAIYPAESATVMADRIQLEQVLMNLVVNARDAMPEGGRLRVLVETNVVTQRVSLRVLDTGVGMSEDVRSHIFEPFFTTKGEGKGTGLGLAVVYGIIQQLGGSIEVLSVPEQGTDFRIELPLVTQPARAEELGNDAASSGTETILLVEDNEPLADIATRVLRRFGYTVIPARNGVDARALMVSEPCPRIDLLVTDVVMPQLSGPELVKQLARAGMHPRVLYMSGYADPVNYAADLDAATDFLPKPWRPHDLAQAVRHALDRAAAAA